MNPVHKNIIANFYKIGVVFVNQILLVPAYLTFLGINVYGDWLVISALTSFFTMSDIGIGNVSNNLFAMTYSKGKINECDVILCNNMAFVIGAWLIVTSLVVIVSVFCNWLDLLRLSYISRSEASYVIIILITQIFVMMSSSVYDSIYNAIHKAHIVTYLNNTLRLASATFIFVTLYSGGNIVMMAASGALPYIAGLFVKMNQSAKWYKPSWKIQHLSIEYIKGLVKPSLGFMFFPLGNAILFQGFTLLINGVFGALILVQFNTMRTMMNFIRNIVQAISAGIKPEFSIAYGQGNIVLLRSLYHKSIKYCVLLAILAIVGIAVVGEPVYEIWTKHEIPFSYPLMAVLGVILLVNSIWEASCITLTSTNKHFWLSATYVMSCLIALASGWCATKINDNFLVVTGTMIITDIIMSVYSINASHKFLYGKDVKQES